LPIGVTAPRPVTTTRRRPSTISSSGLLVLDVLDGVAHGGDAFGGLVGNLDVEGFFQSHHQLNGVEKVRSIVVEQLSVDAGEVKPESNFQNDLGADSLDTVELVMALEEAFDIEIPDEAAEGIATVGDAVKYIQDKQA